MKARLYIKNTWIFKCVSEVEIPHFTQIIKLPIKQTISCLGLASSDDLFKTISTPTVNVVEFSFKSYDKVNDEYIYVNESKSNVL